MAGRRARLRCCSRRLRAGSFGATRFDRIFQRGSASWHFAMRSRIWSRRRCTNPCSDTPESSQMIEPGRYQPASTTEMAQHRSPAQNWPPIPMTDRAERDGPFGPSVHVDNWPAPTAFRTPGRLESPLRGSKKLFKHVSALTSIKSGRFSHLTGRVPRNEPRLWSSPHMS